MNDLPEYNDESKIQIRISKSLREQISKAYSWIDTSEGKIISRATASLSSFIFGDPTGLIVPLILECSNYAVRKRFVRHFPDLLNKMEKSKSLINQKFLLSDLGQKIIRETLRQIIEQDDEQKIEKQKNFLINTLTSMEPDKERIDTFLKILISLEPTQLKILSSLSNSEKTATSIMNMKDSSKPTIPMNLKKDFKLLLGIDDELFERSLSRLESENLITIHGEEIAWATGEYDQEYSKEAIHRMETTLDRIITNFGKNFVDHIRNTNDS